MTTQNTMRLLFLFALTFALFGCKTKESEPVPPTEPERVSPPSEGQFPTADIVNDEGGPVFITGEVAYTNPFFTAGVAEPIVILEDQAGFVDRNRDFIFPIESQVLGQITSDFFTSPFTYNLTLPLVPRGSLRDVDNDGEGDIGVMIFAVAYWTNTWGDAYLERRDQSGGGWSSAYASTRISDDRDNYLEVYGGVYVLYADDDAQGFPSAFGEDGLLFTEDDPIVQLPQGWTMVNMDQEPFIFDRSREPKIDLLEPESIALSNFSELNYLEAFDAMVEKMRSEYAFSDYKNLDWDAMHQEFRPRFEAAEQSGNTFNYYRDLRDFLFSIPDGHVSMDSDVLMSLAQEQIVGGLGFAVEELSDGRVLVNFLTKAGPAELAGIQISAEITAVGGKPIGDLIDSTVPPFSTFSTEHARRREQLIYALRFPLGMQIPVAFTNPGNAPETVELTTEFELDSFFANMPYYQLTGFELPVEYEIVNNDIGYVQITSFFDNELLTIQLWERMIGDLIENGTSNLIIDMRVNGGGSGYLADQMAAYFFDEEYVLGDVLYYDDSIDEFYSDPGDESTFFLPREELQYDGDIVVIVGPDCGSACEFFSYDMTIHNRATVIGHFPTAGLGGSVEDFLMPEDITVRFTIGRAVDTEGNIHIEGIGVVPDVTIPITEEVFNAMYLEGRDVLLEKAVELLGS